MRAKEAKLIPIEGYLSLNGIKPAKQYKNGLELWYSSPIREGDSNPSFKVDTNKNLWFDFGIPEGGNVIDLVCKHQPATVKEALAILEKTGLYNSGAYTIPFPTVNKTTSQNKKLAGEKEKISTFEVLSVSDITRASLINLLKERKINLNIAKKYLKQIHYRPKDKKKSYYALAWACGDGYEGRSKSFKGFIGTKKDLIKINLIDNQTLSIFEGFMDFLAFLTYYDKKDFQSSVIILNSINQRNKAIEEIKNYCFTKIYLFLDNDEGGENTKEFFKNSLESIPIIDKSSLYEKHNDFNEMTIEVSK
jgi:DNA primase